MFWQQLFTSWSAPGAALQMAFTIWMLVDAYHRGVPFYWCWIILLFQPLGPWAYFVIYKLRDFRTPTGGWQRRLSLKELRYRNDRAPTVANRLALAERLMEQGDHADAVPLITAVLAAESNYGQALYALARCHLALGQPAGALPPLQRLNDRDRRWSNYGAWPRLIEAYDALGQPEQALQAHRELEKMQPSLENKCHLAERLIAVGQAAEAIELLDRALEDYHDTPLAARVRTWRWARAARSLVRKAEASSVGETR